MSPFDNSQKLTLKILASDSETEIFVINGDLQLVDRGIGRMTTKALDPGIYKIKTRTGFETCEEYVVLREAGQEVVLQPFPFASAAPLADTSKTHEYHVSAAQDESKCVHHRAGHGSFIFVFSREWTGLQKCRDGPFSINPATGLSIHDGDGNTVVSLESASRVETRASDPWAACNVEVDPGIYRLELALPSGACLEQTLVACPGWQTQIFLLQRDYENTRLADLSKGAAFMAQDKGFSATDGEMRLVELARLGLANRRKVLSSEVRQMLQGKFENPLLGIFGAHLVLLEKNPDLELLRAVVDNLRHLVRCRHPDVEALALAANDPGGYLFAVPPMLRKSWNLIVNETVQQPDLVPVDSPAASAAQNLWSGEPWLVWSESPQAAKGERGMQAITQEPRTESDLESVLKAFMFALPSMEKRFDSPFQAVRKLREAAKSAIKAHTLAPLSTEKPFESTFRAVRGIQETAESEPVSGRLLKLFDVKGEPAPLQLEESKIGFLVRTLGIPRRTVENMLETMSLSQD